MNVTLTTSALIRNISSPVCKKNISSLALIIVARKFSTSPFVLKSEKPWLERQERDPFVKAAGRLNYRARSAFKLLEIDDKFGVFAPGQIVLDCGASPGSWSQVAIQRLRGPPKFKAYTVRQLLNHHKRPTGFDEHEIADFRTSPQSGLVIGFDLNSIAPLTGAAFLSHADIFQSSTRDRIAQVLHQHQLILENVERGKGGLDGPIEEVFQDHPTPSASSAPGSLPRCVDVVMSDMAPNCSGLSSHDHDNISRLARGAYDLAAVFLKAEGTFLFKLWDGRSTTRIIEQLKTRFASVRMFKPDGSRTDSAEIFIVAKGFNPPST